MLLLATTTGSAAAASWCPLTAPPQAALQTLARDAARRSSTQPRAVARLHTEGTLPHQGIADASIEARQDLPLMRDLALLWRTQHDATALAHLIQLLNAWSSIYQPSYNPIDETEFDALIDAYVIARDDLPDASRQQVAGLLHDWAAGYLQRMEHQARPGKGTWTNNWQSHRIKLLTMAAVALDDADLFAAARAQFLRQLDQNLHADGRSIDFDERDALHYVVYDLEPLLRAALAAQARNQDWLRLPAASGVTLIRALDWLLPYARGQQTHAEYANTSVKFDLQRRAAGVPGFSGLWQPQTSTQLYWLAAALDQDYREVAQSLGPEPPWLAACRHQ